MGLFLPMNNRNRDSQEPEFFRAVLLAFLTSAHARPGHRGSTAVPPHEHPCSAVEDYVIEEVQGQKLSLAPAVLSLHILSSEPVQVALAAFHFPSVFTLKTTNPGPVLDT